MTKPSKFNDHDLRPLEDHQPRRRMARGGNRLIHGIASRQTPTQERMMSAADVINEYLDRNAPSFMDAPWRHPSGVVLALWHKQNMWLAAKEMEGAEKPSDKYDRASDAYDKQKARYERAVRDAWSSRQLERLSEGYDIPGIITSERVVA